MRSVQRAFFTPQQRDIVAAVADRIFPGDRESPSASELGVVTYIDRQLAGPWGAGELQYKDGPHIAPEDDGHGWQSDLTPSALYIVGLAAIDAHALREFNSSFLDLDVAMQGAVLEACERSRILIEGGHSSAHFFTLVRTNVFEGLFSDPRHGGNRNLGGWSWLGYPGDPALYGEPYADAIARHGEPYSVSPRAFAQHDDQPPKGHAA